MISGLASPGNQGSGSGGRPGSRSGTLQRMTASLPAPAVASSTGITRYGLEFQRPFDWGALLAYLAPRATPGVERVSADGRYLRTLRLGRFAGWLAIGQRPGGEDLEVDVSATLSPAVALLLPRIRRLLDLDLDPRDVSGHLGSDALLGPLVARRPGLRVAGCVDGFELALRVVLGQQVSVRGASTLAGRLAARLSQPVAGPEGAELRYLPVNPERLAQASLESVRDIGLPASRAGCLIRLAQAVAAGELPELTPGGAIPARPVEEPTEFLGRLTALPGIGPWTATYVAMRGLGWRDAFPDGDLGLRSAIGGESPARMRLLAEGWRPWRSYAAQHLWTGLAEVEP